MKFFIVDIQYTASQERIDDVVNSHRQFLQIGYEKGWLLCSGPKVPRTGGIVIARAPSLQDLVSFFNNDPYKIKNCATHAYMEFNPVNFQSFLADWVSGVEKLKNS